MNVIVQIKNSANTGNVPSSLANGELAINRADGRLFYKHANGTIVHIATGSGSGSANAFGIVNVSGQANVISSTNSDILRLQAGTGIVLTTDPANNLVDIAATGGSATDQFARDQANGAFAKANAAYANANTAIYTAAQIRANISNTAPIHYDAVTGVISHADSGANPTTYGNTTHVPVVTVDSKGHVTAIANLAIALPSGTDQFARDQANAAFDKANSANVLAQTARDHANGAFIQANSAAVRANTLVTDNVPETTTNLYFTAARVRANVSNTFPVSYNQSTGQFGIIAANTNGSILISNTVSGSYDVSQITGGLGIVVTPSAGGIKIDTTIGKTYYLVLTQASDVATYNVALTSPSGNSEVNTQAIFTGTAYSLTSSFLTAPGEPGTTLLPAGTFGRHFRATTDGAGNFAQLRVDLSKRMANGTEVLLRSSESPIFSSANADVLLTWNITDATSYPLVVTDRLLWQIYARRVSGGSGSVQVTVFYEGNTRASYISSTILDAGSDIFARIQANNAYTHANGAFNQANVANTIATSAGLRANTLVTDNVPETTTNLYFTSARARSNVSNTAPINYNSTTGIFSHADSTVTPTTYGNTSFVPQITVDAKGHVTAVTNVAISGGSLPPATANGQLLIGNTVSSSFDVNTLTAGPNIIITNGKGSITIEASSGSSADQFARDRANGAFTTANGAYAHANAAFNKANAATPNTATANGQLMIGNTVSGGFDLNTLTAGYAMAVTNDKGSITVASTGDSFARPQANAAFDKANSANVLAQTARDHANGAFAKANAAVANSGVTTNGSLLIGNTVSGGFDLTTIAQTAPVIVTNGKGTVTLSHASSGVVASGHGTASQVPVFVVDQFGHVTSVTNTDIAITSSAVTESAGGPFFHTAARVRGNVGNTAPINYDPATGIFSHTASGVTATGYGNAATIPVFVVNATGHVTSVTNTAIAVAASQITSGILSVARGGTGKNATGLVNGALLIGNTVNSGFDLVTIAQTAPVIVTNGKGTVTLSHASSGVTPTTYGNANHVFQGTVDAFGHITSASNSKIAIAAAQITSGATANGQLLIGNTVSGAFDVATLTQGTNITITNDKGSITISSSGGGADQFARDTANGAYAHANGAFAHANGAFNKANAATPNTATANGQIYAGNTVSGSFDLTTIAQTAPVIVTNGRGTVTLSHASSGVTATGYGTATQIPVFVVDSFGHVTSVTNTAITGLDTSVLTTGILSVARGGTGKDATGLVNGALLIGNTVNSGFDLVTIAQTAPVIVTNGKGTVTLSHASSGVTPTTYGNASHISSVTVDQYGHITVASNAKVAIAAGQITSGATANGQLLIGNTVSGAFDVNVIAQSAPVIVTNDKGTITVSHARSGVTATGYGTATQIPVFVVDANGHITSVTNTAITGLDTSVLTTGILSVARGGTGKDSTGLVNGALLIGNTVNSGFDLVTIAQTAPVIVTNGKGTVTLSHASSGVTATGYGTAAQVPVFVVDQFGHVTSVTNTAIAIAASAITSGTLAVARGGTGQTAITVNGSLLIGNTVSGGYDVNTLTQGSGITITNDKGSITIAATGGSALDQFARDTANGAYAHANGAYAHANAAFNTANTATPNTATVNGQIYVGNTVSGKFDLTTIAQTSPVIVTNGKGTVTLSHASSGVTATTYGTTTSVAQVTIDAFGHITSASNVAIDQSLAQTARDHANGAFTTANSAYAQANGAFTKANAATPNTATANGQIYAGNTVSGSFDLTIISQTAPVIVTNGRGTVTLSHASSGVVATTYGNSGFVPTVTVDQFGHITTATNTAISITTASVSEAAGGPFYHTSARVRGNVTNTAPINYDPATGTFSHALSGVVATGYGDGATIPKIVVDDKGHVTSVTNNSVAISASQITSGILSVARGGTGKDATGLVNGALLVGNTVNSGFDLVTIAQTAPVIVTNGKGTVTLSHASSGVVATGYGTAAQVPVFVVDQFGHVTSVTNTAISITTASVSESAGGPFYHTSARVRGNVTNTAPINYDSGTGTFSHALSGVVSTGYGTVNTIPVFTVSDSGHVTSVVNTAIAITAAQVTSGTLSVARGGTGQTAASIVNGAVLIGNTVSGGYDVNALTQGTGIVITNDKGSITIAATGGAATDQFARDTANGAYAQANAAFNKANAAVANTGVTTNGSLLIGNTVSGGFDLQTLTQGSGITITNGQGTITIASTGGVSNSFSTINTISIDANTQGNLVAVGSDTLILEAGPGMNISFSVTNGEEITFAINPGYIQAISSGQALHAL